MASSTMANDTFWRVPLNLTPLRTAAEGPETDVAAIQNSMQLIFVPRREGWECMACTETYGWDQNRLLSPGHVTEHARAHQMGLDYALILKKRGILK